MRNISHGARCARILQRIDEAVSPGIQYENGYVQQQAVLLGPVGNMFFGVRFYDGAYLAEAKVVRTDRLKPGHKVVYSSKTQRFDTFEDALSRAASMFSAALADEKTVVDYALSFGDYCDTVLNDMKTRHGREVNNLKNEIQQLTARYGHLLRARDELTRCLRKAGVHEDELKGVYDGSGTT